MKSTKLIYKNNILLLALADFITKWS